MRKTIALATCLLAFGFAGCVQAEVDASTPKFERVLPGDATLDAARIVPHKVVYTKTGGKMVYELQRVELDGRDVFRLQVHFNAMSATPDTMYFDTETLAYVGRKLTMKDYVIEVAVDQGYFTGALTPTEGSDYTFREYDKQHPHNAFEPAVINYFIAALPLAEGYKASIPVFDLNKGSQLLWSNIEVVGRETVEIKGESYDTWKVVSKGIKDKTIWVSIDKPYAIKMKTKGSRGTWMLAP